MREEVEISIVEDRTDELGRKRISEFGRAEDVKEAAFLSVDVGVVGEELRVRRESGGGGIAGRYHWSERPVIWLR